MKQLYKFAGNIKQRRLQVNWFELGMQAQNKRVPKLYNQSKLTRIQKSKHNGERGEETSCKLSLCQYKSRTQLETVGKVKKSIVAVSANTDKNRLYPSISACPILIVADTDVYAKEKLNEKTKQHENIPKRFVCAKKQLRCVQPLRIVELL